MIKFCLRPFAQVWLWWKMACVLAPVVWKAKLVWNVHGDELPRFVEERYPIEFRRALELSERFRDKWG